MVMKKKPIDILNDRARLSMAGKAIIGLVGGIIITVVTLFKKITEREPLNTDYESDLIFDVVDPIAHMDIRYKLNEKYAISMMDTVSYDSVVQFIFNNTTGANVPKGIGVN